MYEARLLYLHGRLTTLLAATDFLLDSPSELARGPDLFPEVAAHYRALIQTALRAEAISSGGAKVLEAAILSWSSQVPALGEIVHVIMADLEWLCARPSALVEISLMRKRQWH